MTRRHDERQPGRAASRALRAFLVPACVALAVAGGASPAAAADYTFTRLPSLGGPQTTATGVDVAGRIVGWSQDTSGFPKPVRWWHGHLEVIDDQGSPAAINDAGVVAGSRSWGGGGATRWDRRGSHVLGGDFGTSINRHGVIGGSDNGSAALFTLAGMRHIGAVDGSFYEAVMGVDDDGDAVGFAAQVDGGGTRGIAAWWDAGTVVGGRELPGLSSQCIASGVNAHRVVVGHCETPDHFIALRWDAGQPTALPGANAAALAINAHGDVVGWASPDGVAPVHAALWTATGLVDLNPWIDPALRAAGWALTSANAINRRGWIVGAMENASTGETAAFLLRPR